MAAATVRRVVQGAVHDRGGGRERGSGLRDADNDVFILCGERGEDAGAGCSCDYESRGGGGNAAVYDAMWFAAVLYAFAFS